jgi:tetratricopeptide (TPR) repeat protein
MPGYQRARVLREGLLHQYPDNERALAGLVQVYTRIGAMDEATGRFPEALEMMQAAAHCNERMLAVHPDGPGYEFGMYKRYNNLGNALLYNERRAEALVPLRKAMNGFASLAAADPANPDYLRLLGMSTTVYGQCLLPNAGMEDSIEAAQHRALALYTEAARRQRGNLEMEERMADAHERLGATLAMRGGTPDSALAHLNTALAIIDHAATSDPSNQDFPQDADLGRIELGLAMALHGDADRAEAVLERAEPRLAAWRHADSTDTRLYGAESSLWLGRGLVAETRARAAHGPAATRSWHEARGELAHARVAFDRDSLAGSWDLEADESRRIAQATQECDLALAVAVHAPAGATR